MKINAPLALLVLAASLLGCGPVGSGSPFEVIPRDGPDEHGYKWERTLVPIERSGWKHHPIADAGDVFLHCELEAKAEGCAILRHGDVPPTCDMYYAASAPQWIKDHEERHCDGWQHPGGLNFTPGERVKL